MKANTNRSRFLVVGVVAISGLMAGAVEASDSTAEVLVKAGLDLRRAGRDLDAIPKFEEAFKTERTPRTAAQLGMCLQAVARWAEADPLLAEALSFPRDPWVKKNRIVLKESQEVGKSHMGRLEVLGEPAGASVSISGHFVGMLPLSVPVSVNEGEIDIAVTAIGFKRSFRTIMVKGASYQRIVFSLEVAPSSHPEAAIPQRFTSAREETSLASTSDDIEEEHSSIFRSPWLWGGVGAAMLGAAILIFSSSSPSYPHVDDSRAVE